MEVEGCQDGLACNFDPEATDPSECYYLELSTFVDENILNVTCPGASDGSFTIYTSGGNGPYSIYIEDFNGEEYTSESVDGVFIVSPWKRPSFKTPSLTSLKIFGKGLSGV